MSTRTLAIRFGFLALLALGLLSVMGGAPNLDLQMRKSLRESRAATHSGPIAVTPDDDYVWVANPDNDSVTQIEVDDDENRVRERIEVGDEPQNVAITPDGKYVYVSNTGSGTVSVIRAKGDDPKVVETIEVGTEPYGMAITPDGEKLYVANARSNTVSVIETDRNRVVRTIRDVGLEPRGVAITSDGDEHGNDEKVYVTQFLGVDVAGVLIGRDDYKEGRVTVISTRTDKVIGQVVLHPLASGFNSNGSVLNGVAATNPPTFTFATTAFPNQLNSIVIKGNRAYLPNTGASPDGPVRFNVNVQALLSVIDLGTDAEGQAGGATQSINMNRGVQFEAAATRLFFAVPWAVEFKHGSNEGYAVIAGSNVLVKVDLDANGTPTIHAPTAAGDAGAVVRIEVGQNPRGIAINRRDDRAYVMNEVSRDVSVVNLVTNTVIATVQSAKLPKPGTEAAVIQIGKGVFNSSTGVNIPGLGTAVAGRRLSSDGWGACSACHPFGLTDGVVWIFATGPRRTLPLNGSFNPRDPRDAKILNHSAIFDELQDFELNIRNVSGGPGLITLADGTPDPVVAAFTPPNAGRSAALDAMALYVARGVRTPISPLASAHGHDGGPDVSRGRRLFEKNNCASCHGGEGWSSSRRDFTPPPAATEIVNTQLVRFLRKVGTFDPAAANELRANGAPALGADGINLPSLLGAHALGPFLHNGSALTLDQVMENVAHRSAGTAGVDRLKSRGDREDLVAFVASIDASTSPIGAERRSNDDDDRAVVLSGAPVELGLELASGNPTRGEAMLRYTLPSAGRVDLALFDVQGRRIATLVSRESPAGRFDAAWNGRSDGGATARAGIYFARLRTGVGQRVVKFVRER